MTDEWNALPKLVIHFLKPNVKQHKFCQKAMQMRLNKQTFSTADNLSVKI